MSPLNLDDLKRILRCLESAGIDWLEDPETGAMVKVDSVLSDIITLEAGGEVTNLLHAETNDT